VNGSLLPQVPVLGYHHVHDGEDSFFRTWPASFQLQMEILVQAGYVPATPERLCAQKGAGGPAERLALVTFDDAYQDFRQFAWPILDNLRIPATLFVIADAIGGWNDWDDLAPRRHRHLTAGELRELHRSGVRIGSHTRSHRPLVRLSDAELLSELRDSRHFLEDLLGGAVPTLAYPGGAAGLRERIAAEEWYELAFAVDPGPLDAFCDPYLIPRFDPCFHQGPEDFLGELERHTGRPPTGDGEIP
jgi:peptidoglycan/xylan/chitin deacetylase (PgdA/CDA1 family)